jgi:hypothetical protein
LRSELVRGIFQNANQRVARRFANIAKDLRSSRVEREKSAKEETERRRARLALWPLRAEAKTAKWYNPDLLSNSEKSHE